MLKGQQKIKIKLSLTNSLQHQNGIFEGGNGFNAFSRKILFAMKIFCHIGNDKYYRLRIQFYGYNNPKKLLYTAVFPSVIEVDNAIDTK